MSMRYKPTWSNILVDPIITTVSLEKRAENAGLHIILEQDNVPKVTQGRVVALGSDPLLHEEIKIGDIVMFNHHSGHDVFLEGHQFRQISHQEVTGILDEVTPSSPQTDQSSSGDQQSPVCIPDKPE